MEDNRTPNERMMDLLRFVYQNQTQEKGKGTDSAAASPLTSMPTTAEAPEQDGQPARYTEEIPQSMAGQEIQTPKYWEEDWYQPLVEVTTIYGNPVKIPERWRSIWEFDQELMEQGRESREGYAAGLKQVIEMRGYNAADLARVFLEIYQEKD